MNYCGHQKPMAGIPEPSGGGSDKPDAVGRSSENVVCLGDSVQLHLPFFQQQERNPKDGLQRLSEKLTGQACNNQSTVSLWGETPRKEWLGLGSGWEGGVTTGCLRTGILIINASLQGDLTLLAKHITLKKNMVQRQYDRF